MEAGGKDCEEETLQTAFKKLRVDAESLPGAVSVSEALVSRVASRVCLDVSGAKPKLGCPKDNWHGCMRKTSRGASRTQRRRRSKSPILHPPKFTYCSTAVASALSTSSGGLKHQRLAAPEPSEPRHAGDAAAALPSSAQKELSSSGAAAHVSPLVFGSCAGYETRVAAAVREIPAAAATTPASSGQDGGRSGDQSSEEGAPEKSACGGAEPAAGGAAGGAPSPPRTSAEAADFRALSERHGGGGVSSAELPHVSCSCAWKKKKKGSDPPEETGQSADPECRCGSLHRDWSGVEVYSFTGLRNVPSESERSREGAAHRTLNANATAASASPPPPSSSSSGSPRSCSEQARVYVDDITIEDLSGYMEYYLYIPKKMSHMAEMMYT
ncbi:oxidative stress-responsive serine-rich protein 1 [Cebidichthys violaceus]|uniref:oxidative stress-responsive serine-rich protein 1 n=1 Tax=Cebidichthys violaceus TaxID=271503 RepID=UPI0035CB25D1